MTINLAAPVISRHRITIAAPIERVWDVQTDVNAWPEWRPDVDTAVLAGPMHAFRWTTVGLDITSTVTAVDPLRRLEWGGPANGITAVHVWRFEATERGVVVSTEESWEGAPIDAAVRQMQQALDASLIDWLHRLKSRCEAVPVQRTPETD